jgi:uncharacterized protein with PQ loop repeat
VEIWLGWISSVILLLTLMGQVLQQWRSQTVAGVSPWLFWGQISASVGFVAYSALINNRVFIVTNTLILITAIAGQVILRYKRRRENGGRTPSQPPSAAL